MKQSSCLLFITLSLCLTWGSFGAAQKLTRQPGQTPPVVNRDGSFYVTDYGAVCNGTTDDTAAIQAAIYAAEPGGTVVLPASRCHTTGTLYINDPSGQQATEFVSIRGSNPITSQLAYSGSGVSLYLQRNKYFTLENFGLLNTGSRGSTTGLYLGGYGTAGGTETLQGIVRHLNIAGFSTDIQAGDGGSATSEMRYDSVELTNADVGWANNNFNTLNQVFTMLSLGQCGVGLKQGVGNVTVRGGSTYGNGIDFFVGGDLFDIEGVRAQLSVGSTFVKVGIINTLRISHNITTQDNGPTTHAVDIYVARAASITDNFFIAPMLVEEYVWPGGLIVSGNLVNGAGSGGPLIWGIQGNVTQFTFEGNGDDQIWVSYPDTKGVH